MIIWRLFSTKMFFNHGCWFLFSKLHSCLMFTFVVKYIFFSRVCGWQSSITQAVWHLVRWRRTLSSCQWLLMFSDMNRIRHREKWLERRVWRVILPCSKSYNKVTVVLCALRCCPPTRDLLTFSLSLSILCINRLFIEVIIIMIETLVRHLSQDNMWSSV